MLMTVRDRIWKTLDDPALGRHESLRNALYQLLVASECPASGSASVEQCLELTAEAIRDGGSARVTKARAVIDALVATLVGCAPTGVATPCIVTVTAG
jgi:hypothetical protein